MVTRGEAGLAEEGSQGGRRNGRHSGSLTISAWVARGQINPEPDIPASPGLRAPRLDAAGTSRDRSRVCPALPFRPFPPRPPRPPSSARLTPASSALGSEAASSAAHPGVRLVSRARTPRVSPFVRRDMPPGDFLTDPCPQRTACAQHPAPRLTENGRPETAVDRKDEGRRGVQAAPPSSADTASAAARPRNQRLKDRVPGRSLQRRGDRGHVLKSCGTEGFRFRLRPQLSAELPHRALAFPRGGAGAGLGALLASTLNFWIPRLSSLGLHV